MKKQIIKTVAAVVCSMSIAALAQASCVTATSGGSWQNSSMSPQSGTFTATFDTTPSASPDNALIALSNGAQTAYASFSCLVRFNTSGHIDAYNGTAYAAASTISYSAGTSYHFSLAVNLTAKTYSITVTPAGGSAQTVGTNYAFRASATSLNNWGTYVDANGGSGTLQVCNFSTGGSTTYTITASAGTGGSITPSGAVTVNQGATQAFTITPSSGYTISSVTVDGASQGAISSYTFSNVQANHTISAAFQAQVSEGPYGGTPAAIPGTVQAENYDTGGQGLAYNVTSINGTDNGYRSDGVDLEVTSDTGGGVDLGWTTGGQWFKYTVNVATAGTYTVSFRVAGPSAVTDAFHIANASGTNLSGAVNLPGTGGWQTWGTVTANVTLPAGQQVLTLNQDNGGWNINYMGFAQQIPTFTITASAGANGSISPSGAVTVNQGASQSFTISPNSGYNVSSVTVDGVNLGTMTSYTFSNVQANHTISAAFQQQVVEGPFGGTPAAIPGTVQAENYDTGGQGLAYNVTSINGTDNGYRSDGVDLEVTSDTGGGVDLGWTSPGQWFKYTVNVATAGTYTVSFRVAAPGAVTDAFHLSNASGTNLSGNVNLPATGGYQTWATVTANVTLPAGQQVLTLNQDNGNGVWNINYMTFANSGGTVAAPSFSPAGGTYTSAQTVTITTTTGGASIRYTTDGSAPSETNGTIYSGPVIISATTTLNAIAYESGFTDSTITSATYTIGTGTPWSGTWGVTPQSGGQSFNNQTIRQIVFTSAGGSTAQLRLSNLFGSQSVSISDVHIALIGTGSSIQSSTDHVVTFGGSGSVTIGAGAEVNSDSIPMTIPSLSAVAISFYFPNSTNVQTFHQFSFQTNYVANGDVSGSTNLSVVSTPASYFLITNLNVQSPALTGAVVTLGASITDGYASTQNANHRWPNFLAQRLSSAGIDVGVINQGVSGNQLLNNNNTLSALNRFQHDAVSQPNVKWVIFSDDPINDVSNNSSITGAQLIAGVKQLISQAHLNGLKFLGSTLTPFHGAGGWTSAGETARDQYNAFILSSSSGCDGVVDQDTATHDPSNPTQFLPAYDSGDHLHPNDAGYQAIANAVNLSLLGTPTEAPFGGTPAAVPGTVQAEDYDTGGQGLAYNVTSINGTANGYRSDGVDLETTSDTGGGYDLGWSSSGQWFKYTVNVATAGVYTVSFRVASVTAVGSNAGSFHLQTPSGTNLSGAINVPGTGGWQTWTTITASVTLPAGQQIIELFEDNGGYNFNYMTFTSSGGQVVAAPAFSPGGGTFSTVQNVTITTTTSGASIRYTTDGSTPSETNGTIYSGPVNITSTATLNAIAYESGFTDSTITSGTYIINLPPPQVAAPAFSPAGGSYTSAPSVSITTSTGGASIRYTTDGSTPSETAGTIYSGPVNIGSTATLKAIAYESGFADSTVTSAGYTINLPPPQVAAPTFSPVGGTYTSAQSVTIATTTGGASIRYTTDGSTPSETAGTIYSGPVSIGSTATLNAIAYESGFADSTVASAGYTINPPPPPVTVGATTPFVSYEAEAGTLGGGATVVSLTSPPTTQYSSPALEASGHAYVQLTGTGQYVQWTNNTGQNITAINLRSCIPDAPNGGGIASTIDLYVNGVFRQAFSVNSQQNYCYEGLNYNDQTNKNPSAGDPRDFWNDTHEFITGAPVAPGSTIRFQMDAANTAAFYYIDVIDVENPPPPLAQPANSLSITSYGAVANNSSVDNTSAINNCFSAAQSQGKIAWIPSGTFYFSAINGGLQASGITIEGAGPWYSTLYRVTPPNNTQGTSNIITAASTTLENVLLDCNGSSRATNNNDGAVDFSGSNWLVNNVWIQHVTSSFWCAGDNGMAENCRTLSVWSDGGNFNNVQDSRGIGTNLTYFNNFVRGTGDDAMAINSVHDNGGTIITTMSNITYANNTAVAPWGGKCIGIYGGSNITVKNNLLSDTARYLGLGVMKFGVDGSDLLSATVTGNTVLRCGGNGYNQQQQAVMIGNGGDGQGVGTVENAYVGSNTITDALYDGIGFSASLNIVLQDNIINSPGLNGIAFGNATIDLGTVSGCAVLLNNTVNNLNSGQVAVATQSGTSYQVSTPTPASSFSAESGVQTENCSEGGLDVGTISNGSYTVYNQVNLNGLVTFIARVASAGSGGNIEIHLDSPTGTLIGTSSVPVTGGWQTWTDTQCTLSGASGTHNLYLVYTGGSGFLFNVQWFALTGQTSSSS